MTTTEGDDDDHAPRAPLKKPHHAPTNKHTHKTHNSKNTNAAAGGTFTASTCVPDNAGLAVCTIGLVAFQGEVTTTKVLWAEHQTKNYKVYIAAVTGVIDETVVDATRSALAEKLGVAVNTYIADLDI